MLIWRISHIAFVDGWDHIWNFLLYSIVARAVSSINQIKWEHLEWLLEVLELPQYFRSIFTILSLSLSPPLYFRGGDWWWIKWNHNEQCLHSSCFCEQVARAVLENPSDKTKVYLIYANVKDILLKVIYSISYRIYII